MRQQCNVAFSIFIEGAQSDPEDKPDAQTAEEKVREFEEEIGQRRAAEASALERLKAWQAANGIVYDNPDAPLTGPLAEIAARQNNQGFDQAFAEADLNIEYD